MSKIKVGLPSKGRIQEEMNNFLTSAGIDIKKDGGQRTDKGIRHFEPSEKFKEERKNNWDIMFQQP